jgi:hypothetical protein
MAQCVKEKKMVSNEYGAATNSSSSMTRIQIFKHVTNDRVLDISDLLSLDPRRNKISFTLLEYDEERRSKTRVRHFVDVPDFKLVCWDILHGTFSEWTDHKGSPSSEDGGLQARVLTLRKDPKYRQPFVLKIDNGVGEQIGNGAVKMVRATDSLTLLLPEWDARRMAQTVLDYVRDWETVNFRRRQEAQTVLIPLPGMESAAATTSRQGADHDDGRSDAATPSTEGGDNEASAPTTPGDEARRPSRSRLSRAA